MKKVFLPLLLTAFIFGSCQKQNQVKEVKNNSPAQAMLGTGFDYNLVGEAHNNYFIYIRNNPNFFNMTEEDLYNYGQSYVDSFFGSSIQIPYSEELTLIKYTDTLTDNLMENGTLPGSKLLQDSLITSVMKPYINLLASLLLNAADTSHNPYTPMQFTQLVNGIESQIYTKVLKVKFILILRRW